MSILTVSVACFLLVFSFSSIGRSQHVLNYGCDLQAQECESACIDDADPEKCSRECNRQYLLCRELEERSLEEQEDRSTIVPPATYKHDQQ